MLTKWSKLCTSYKKLNVGYSVMDATRFKCYYLLKRGSGTKLSRVFIIFWHIRLRGLHYLQVSSIRCGPWSSCLHSIFNLLKPRCTHLSSMPSEGSIMETHESEHFSHKDDDIKTLGVYKIDIYLFLINFDTAWETYRFFL